jgi:hypothetical protein
MEVSKKNEIATPDISETKYFKETCGFVCD